jgi:hypothetical protein
LSLSLDGSEWSASRPEHFTTEERTAFTSWIKASPIAGIGSCRDWNPGTALYRLNYRDLYYTNGFNVKYIKIGEAIHKAYFELADCKPVV